MKKLPLPLWLCICLLCAPCLNAQFINGPRGGASASSNAAVGSIGWGNLTNSQVSDNVATSATASLSAYNTRTTEYFIANNFSFAIPPTATITGISATVVKKGSGLAGTPYVRDNYVYLIKNGSIQTGSNRASVFDWTSSYATSTYGGTLDAWGNTWTPAIVNAADFGLALSASMYSGGYDHVMTADIDYVAITVHYTDIVLPIELSVFSAEVEPGGIDLQWETQTETNSDHFVIERSQSITSGWEPLAEQPAAGTSEGKLSYHYLDASPGAMNYYRLKQVDKNQRYSYSHMVAMEYLPESTGIIIAPIPAADHLFVSWTQTLQKIEFYDAAGQLVKTAVPNPEVNNQVLDISSLNAGSYLLKALSNSGCSQLRFIKLP